jgi:4-azaleucine resistance transporter AzlC
LKTVHADGKSSAFTLTIPVAIGYIPLGAVFGFLFVQAGAHWWQALLASALVYAGAAQYMMVPMVAAGLPVASIALAALLVNLRHVFYGLSLLDRFPARGMLRWYMVFGLTDETFSILTTLPRDASVRDMAMMVFLNQCWWLLGTAIGAFAGAHATLPLRGLDFVLASLFAVLLAEQWRQRSSAAPLWIALASYGIGTLAAPRQALLIAIGLCVLAALAWKSRDGAKAPKEIE